MNREQLAHLLRAACRIAADGDVLVIGSQSILGSYDEAELPPQATMSIEADVAFLDDPERVKADQVEGAIGELSQFHDTNGYYAEGVHVETAILPEGWRHRLVQWSLQSAEPATPHFLDPHDLAVAKLAAYRSKDLEFVGALLTAGLIDRTTLLQRASMLSNDHADRRQIVLDYLHGLSNGSPSGEAGLA